MYRTRTLLKAVQRSVVPAASRALRGNKFAATQLHLASPLAARQQFMASARSFSTLKTSYDAGVAERAAQGIVPKPLNAADVGELVELLKNPPAEEKDFLLNLLANRVPPGVDEAAYVKASFLSAVAKGEATSPIVSREYAIELLSTMQGGYNIATLVELLEDEALGGLAADGLSHTLLVFDAFHDVDVKAKAGNANAKRVLESWANAEWFLAKPAVPEKITVTVFKVSGG